MWALLSQIQSLDLRVCAFNVAGSGSGGGEESLQRRRPDGRSEEHTEKDGLSLQVIKSETFS
jgi:hypothetical protein